MPSLLRDEPDNERPLTRGDSPKTAIPVPTMNARLCKNDRCKSAAPYWAVLTLTRPAMKLAAAASYRTVF